MNQRRNCATLGRFVIGLMGLSAILATVACDSRSSNAPTTKPGTVPATNPARVTIASLVPSATALVIAIGGREQLVGVSNVDTSRDEITGLPRVGDYQSIDWEKLGEIKPTYLVTFHESGREPPGVKQHAAALGIQMINVKIERMSDVVAAFEVFGEKLGRPEGASDARKLFGDRMETLRNENAKSPRVPTFIAMGEQGGFTAGPDTFLNDALEIAGGVNVVKENTPRYPKLDNERILELKPEVVFVLLPGASEQVKAAARQNWSKLTELPAVKNGRVYLIDEWYALQPGPKLVDLAKIFSEKLHPAAGAK